MGTGTRATRRWRASRGGPQRGSQGPGPAGSAGGGTRRVGTRSRRRREKVRWNKKKRDAHRAARPPALGRACIRPRNLDCRHTSTSAAHHHETHQHIGPRASASAYHLLDVSRIRIVNAGPGAPPGTLCTGPDATRAIGTRGVSGSGNCVVKSFL